MVCDLMQYYHISDWRSYPVSFIATLTAGLPITSRTKSGQDTPLDVMLLAATVDRLSMLLWAKTEDGQKNRNRPASLYDRLVSGAEEKQASGFNSVEEFEAVRAKLFGGE